jgi:hypothetical protein
MNIALQNLRFPLILTCQLPLPSRLFTLDTTGWHSHIIRIYMPSSSIRLG